VTLSVAILVDVVVIVMFSLAVEFAHAVHGGSYFDALLSFIVPFLHIFLSLILGAILGEVCLAVLLWQCQDWNEKVKGGVILIIAGLWYYFVQEVLHSEPLLMCVMTGVWTANRDMVPYPSWLRAVMPTCRLPGLLNHGHTPNLGYAVGSMLPLVRLSPPAPFFTFRGNKRKNKL
jgi:hypothetical protein